MLALKLQSGDLLERAGGAHIGLHTACRDDPDGEGGGNPCPVVFGAESLSDGELLALAAGFGHETAFVVPATGDADGAEIRLTHALRIFGQQSGAMARRGHDPGRAAAREFSLVDQ